MALAAPTSPHFFFLPIYVFPPFLSRLAGALALLAMLATGCKKDDAGGSAPLPTPPVLPTPTTGAPQMAVWLTMPVPGNLQNVACKTPNGKRCLVVLHTGTTLQKFTTQYKGKVIGTSLCGGAVATYIW